MFFFSFFSILTRNTNRGGEEDEPFICVGLFLLSLKKRKINNTPVGYGDITPH